MRIDDPLQQGEASLAAAASTRRLLEQLHGAVQDYDLVVPQALLEQSRQTQRLFNLVMGCMAGISLLVGGIGIMNIMLASVLERTREIGVRRAVGARRIDVQLQFVAESFTISLIGGIAGILFGIGLARGIAVYAGWTTVVSVGALVHVGRGGDGGGRDLRPLPGGAGVSTRSHRVAPLRVSAEP